MKKTYFIFIQILLLTSITGSSWAIDRLVPNQYATIQEAIDDCNNGDVVIVSPGTYTGMGNQGINFDGLAITVRSTDPNDPCVVAATIIDCKNEDSGFYFGSGEGNDSILAGLTIIRAEDGSGYRAGGINCESSDPTLRNLKILQSLGYSSGGIGNFNSSPKIINCTFRDNSGDYGGGVANWLDSSPAIINCKFRKNSAWVGGGISNANSSPAVTNCTFSENSASQGGGIYNEVSSPTVTNCTFSGNSASNWGGCVDNEDSSPTVTNCTFSDNSALSGGAIMIRNSSSLTLTNCILWGNDASNGNEIALYNTSAIDVNYCDVQGGLAGIYNDGNGVVDWGSGNINDNPSFFDANNPDPKLRDYHLRANSPCIDAGYNTAVWTLWDIDGDVRISDGIVDMGSDEVIWDSAEYVSPEDNPIVLNPGGGADDPNIEAIVVFDNNSEGDANVAVVEMSSSQHSAMGGFGSLGTTLRIDTTLEDGDFFMTVTIAFDGAELAGEDWRAVDLMYWYGETQEWVHAVNGNSGSYNEPGANHFEEEYPPTAVPTLEDLMDRTLGANGVFWNNQTQRGFVWANVDHTTDFEGMVHNIADFEPDGDVDLVDFAYFADWWLEIGCGLCDGADFTGDGNVDWNDLREFCDNWLADL